MDNKWFEVNPGLDVPAEFECAGDGPLGLWKKFLSSIDRMQLPRNSSVEIREPRNLVCKVLWRAYCACRTREPQEMCEAICLVLEGFRTDVMLDFRQTVTGYYPEELPEPLSLWVRKEYLLCPELQDPHSLEVDGDWPPALMDPAQRLEVTAYCAGCGAEGLPSRSRRFGK